MDNAGLPGRRSGQKSNATNTEQTKDTMVASPFLLLVWDLLRNHLEDLHPQ